MRRVPLARSASLRLTLAIAGLILFMAVMAMAVQYRTAAQALERQQADLLQSDIDSFAELYDQRRIPALRQAIAERAAQTPQGRALYLLQDRNGRTLAGNLPDWPEDLPAMAGGVTEARKAAEESPGEEDLQLKLAEALAAERQFEEAFEVCLGIVQRDRDGLGQDARDALVTFFGMPTANPELVSTARRRLATLLY